MATCELYYTFFLLAFLWIESISKTVRIFHNNLPVKLPDLSTKSKIKTESSSYWPNNTIPYVLHKSCDSECRNFVLEAMKDWETDTCVRFDFWGDQEKVLQARESQNYVIFRADQPGDIEAMGGGQSVNFGVGCFQRNKLLHELGHVLNLEHVHTRYDRDLYVQVNMDNVIKDMEDQYQKRSDKERVPYDYRSIMHYQSSDFSVDPFVRPTMSTKLPILQYLIDEPRQGLSFYDKKQVNLVYNCFLACRLRTYCLNQGIPVQRKSGCQCLCPPMTTGKNCGILLTDRSQPLLLRSGKQRCGGLVNKPGILQSPGYPFRKKPFASCGWILNAPSKHRVEIVFDDFWFADESKDLEQYPGKCVSERIEIRCRGVYQPDIYCGKQLNATKIVSRNNYLIINIIADESMTGRGFSARFRFIR